MFLCGTVFCTLAGVAQIEAIDQYFIMITFRKHSDWFLFVFSYRRFDMKKEAKNGKPLYENFSSKKKS